MPKDVVAVETAGPHRWPPTFEDGVSGEVDMARLVACAGVFAPLADPERFRTVRVPADAGTVVWPNAADLDPVVLYAEVTSEPVERQLASTRASSERPQSPPPRLGRPSPPPASASRPAPRATGRRAQALRGPGRSPRRRSGEELHAVNGYRQFPIAANTPS